MIFQWPDLAVLHARNRTVARETLIKMLGGLQDNSGRHIAVVFDGTGTKAAEAKESHPVQVFYSRDGQTADSIIERLVVKYAKQCDITVATDDGLERTTVESFGASSMSSRQLRDEIEAAERDLGERLRQLRRC
jgi:predicted RNA-binding protein with PIN domain